MCIMVYLSLVCMLALFSIVRMGSKSGENFEFHNLYRQWHVKRTIAARTYTHGDIVLHIEFHPLVPSPFLSTISISISNLSFQHFCFM